MKSEQAADLAGVDVDVDAAVGGVGGGAGHHADRAGHGAEELGAAVDQDVTDGQTPALGHALDLGLVGQGQVGLDHHGAEVGIVRIALEALGLLGGERRPIDAVGAVDFLGNQLDALTQRHFQRIEELQINGLFAGVDNGLGQFLGAFAAVTPMVGSGAADALLLAEALDQLDLGVGVGVELVDADDGLDAGLLDGVHMVEQVLAALLQELQVLGLVLLGQGLAGHDSRAAAVHLQSADGADQDGDVGGQAAEAGLDVPELLKADIGSEAGLSDMVVEQLEGQTVADDGALADGDVGEGAGA